MAKSHAYNRGPSYVVICHHKIVSGSIDRSWQMNQFIIRDTSPLIRMSYQNQRALYDK